MALPSSKAEEVMLKLADVVVVVLVVVVAAAVVVVVALELEEPQPVVMVKKNKEQTTKNKQAILNFMIILLKFDLRELYNYPMTTST